PSDLDEPGGAELFDEPGPRRDTVGTGGRREEVDARAEPTCLARIPRARPSQDDGDEDDEQRAPCHDPESEPDLTHRAAERQRCTRPRSGGRSPIGERAHLRLSPNTRWPRPRWRRPR